MVVYEIIMMYWAISEGISLVLLLIAIYFIIGKIKQSKMSLLFRNIVQGATSFFGRVVTETSFPPTKQKTTCYPPLPLDRIVNRKCQEGYGKSSSSTINSTENSSLSTPSAPPSQIHACDITETMLKIRGLKLQQTTKKDHFSFIEDF